MQLTVKPIWAFSESVEKIDHSPKSITKSFCSCSPGLGILKITTFQLVSDISTKHTFLF